MNTKTFLIDGLGNVIVTYNEGGIKGIKTPNNVKKFWIARTYVRYYFGEWFFDVKFENQEPYLGYFELPTY